MTGRVIIITGMVFKNYYSGTFPIFTFPHGGEISEVCSCRWRRASACLLFLEGGDTAPPGPGRAGVRGRRETWKACECPNATRWCSRIWGPATHRLPEIPGFIPPRDTRSDEPVGPHRKMASWSNVSGLKYQGIILAKGGADGGTFGHGPWHGRKNLQEGRLAGVRRPVRPPGPPPKLCVKKQSIHRQAGRGSPRSPTGECKHRGGSRPQCARGSACFADREGSIS